MQAVSGTVIKGEEVGEVEGRARPQVRVGVQWCPLVTKKRLLFQLAVMKRACCVICNRFSFIKLISRTGLGGDRHVYICIYCQLLERKAFHFPTVYMPFPCLPFWYGEGVGGYTVKIVTFLGPPRVTNSIIMFYVEQS